MWNNHCHFYSLVVHIFLSLELLDVSSRAILRLDYCVELLWFLRCGLVIKIMIKDLCHFHFFVLYWHLIHFWRYLWIVVWWLKHQIPLFTLIYAFKSISTKHAENASYIFKCTKNRCSINLHKIFFQVLFFLKNALYIVFILTELLRTKNEFLQNTIHIMCYQYRPYKYKNDIL